MYVISVFVSTLLLQLTTTPSYLQVDTQRKRSYIIEVKDSGRNPIENEVLDEE